jgi:hypothetical protein
MPRKEFTELIIDNDTRSFGIVGYSTDDTGLTNLTWEMQQLGMHVRCSTDDSGKSKEEIVRVMKTIGLTLDDQLYSRLLQEYRRKQLMKDKG